MFETPFGKPTTLASVQAKSPERSTLWTPLVPSRAERLSERFRLIQQTLRELHGEDVAFAAAAAAWLMAIQYGAAEGMRRVAGSHGRAEVIVTMDEENEEMLRGFHQELCSHLGVEPKLALDLAASFAQVVNDICFQGG